MEKVTGFLKIELANGKDVEILNEEGLKVKRSIYEEWKSGAVTKFENEEIHDMHFNFFIEE